MPERKLATIEKVLEVLPIEGADNIESIRVRGWTVVTKKGEFKKDDLCVYFELDSFLPVHDQNYAFLLSRGTKVQNEVTGHVLKTAKLRGVYSQGLVLPLGSFPTLALLPVGTDVSEEVGITKYEPPIPAELKANTVGAFPTQFAKKTDAERIQNLKEWFASIAPNDWFATEKVDGTSATYINDGGILRVCGRNWELAPSTTNTYWKKASELDLLSVLPFGMVLQAELYGEGIQANPLGVKGQHLAAFALWQDRLLLPRSAWPESILAFSTPEYDLTLPTSVDDAISQADGIKSLLSPNRLAEGIVWHHAKALSFAELDNRSCFKVISNKWLLKH